jgi:hypothetical protein
VAVPHLLELFEQLGTHPTGIRWECLGWLAFVTLMRLSHWLAPRLTRGGRGDGQLQLLGAHALLLCATEKNTLSKG